MILRALTEYYKALASQGRIARLGWTQAKISYGLNISGNGELMDLLPLKSVDTSGKKLVERPQDWEMPARPAEKPTRSSGIDAQFLWDKCQYMLGYDVPGKQERAKKCFAAAGEKCREVLKDAHGAKAEALKAWFSKWDPDQAAQNTMLAPYLDDLVRGANLTFFVCGEKAVGDIEICQAWDRFYAGQSAGTSGYCSVIGRKAPLARLHPNIKGVRGAQSSGAALVSFNAPSFLSYGHEQGENANVSEYAAFAYTTALNSLIADKKHSQQIGDTTIVFWSEGAEEAPAELWSYGLDDSNAIRDKDLKTFFESLSQGHPVTFRGAEINPDKKFYILGLSPNAARISVRFFLVNTFGRFVSNLERFHRELEIVRPSYDARERLAIWQILQETANKNSRDKAASPHLAGAVMRSVLAGARYPEALFQNIMLRVRSDQDNPDKFIEKVSRAKAAVIKAYLIRNVKEEMTVGLNTENTSAAYLLGRLFAVLEHLQEVANSGINSTIKDRYFNSACATPGTVFPILIRLAMNHRKKIAGDKEKKGLAISLEKSISQLMGGLEKIPQRLTLPEQGEFILGYYHQVQYRYTKKEEK